MTNDPPHSPSEIQSPRQAVPWFLWVAIGLFGLVFSWWSIQKALVYDGYGQDLGNMWQSVWNLAHGHGYTFTHPQGGLQLPRLAIHADYLLLPFLPTAFLASGWKLWLIVQAFGLALSAWPLYLLARHWLRNLAAASIISLAFLFSGATQFPVLWQFHSVVLAVPAIFAFTYSVVAGQRTRWSWIWFAVALLAGEQVGFILGLLAFFLWLKHHHPRQASLALAIGWGWSLAHFLFIIPAFRPDNLGPHLLVEDYFGSFGSTAGQQLQNLLHPTTLFSQLWRADHAWSLLFLLAPYGFLSLLSPFIFLGLLAIVPQWLSDLAPAHVLYHQHHVLALPLLALAAVDGWRRIRARSRFRISTTTLAAWVAGWSLIGVYLFSPWSFSPNAPADTTTGDTDLGRFAQTRTLIPNDATTAFTPGLGPLFRNFPISYQLPDGIGQAEYLVFYHPRVVLLRGRQAELNIQAKALEQQVRASDAFVQVYENNRGRIYRRLQNRSFNPDLKMLAD